MTQEKKFSTARGRSYSEKMKTEVEEKMSQKFLDFFQSRFFRMSGRSSSPTLNEIAIREVGSCRTQTLKLVPIF